MGETPSETSGPNPVFAFFANPWVGIVGSVASILGVLLAAYFYFQSVSYPELVYYVNPARAVVVKQGTASRLTVSFDGRPVAQDVTATQVAIWNRGREAIRRTAVLQPIIIRTEPRVPILEATIRKKSREVVALDLDQTRLVDGEVSVSWNILEQGDGGVVQLVYAAGPDTKIQCLGVIEGQPGIRELRYSGTIRSPAEQMRGERMLRYVLAFMLLAGVAIFLLGLIMVRLLRRDKAHSLGIITYVMYVVAPVLIIVLSLYMIFTWSLPQPPFGFE
jgi:hypothetical protein